MKAWVTREMGRVDWFSIWTKKPVFYDIDQCWIGRHRLLSVSPRKFKRLFGGWPWLTKGGGPREVQLNIELTESAREIIKAARKAGAI